MKIRREAQFSFAPDTSWGDAALDTVDAAQRLYGSEAAATVRQAFEERGIL
jgi:zinc metalloprotease ZmpB